MRTKYFLLLFVLLHLVYTSCGTTRSISSSNVKVHYLKKEFWKLPDVIIEVYDFNTKKSWPAFIEVNGLIQDWDREGDEMGKFKLQLRPGKHNLVIASIGMETLTLKKLNVTESDSIIIKAYLEDSKEILYDH
ncbi:hypothetical protein [Zeaxanthinibacter enoshimensis]|uniref:Carboxypeptidase-like protein n=1 Tax=Zeaxanthinibacter enoshimensis TaxID=392009 RepID=A0A4R6TEI5_9FLAO|nr:hypothetical protein [Zeaxanthinibacter enoshimensis]TDQ28143.1 hypothetical protein CLV82_2973 [Zeaxanthinibacter enoshimensis]